MHAVAGRRRQPDAGRSGIVPRPQEASEAKRRRRGFLAAALGAAAMLVHPIFDSPALLG